MQSVTANESQNDDFTMGSAGPNIPRQTPANIGPGAPTPPPPNPGNGLTALAVNYGEAASDPEDTTQRAAVRSSIAEALHTWGCREDPNGWDWTHLGDALESTLRTRELLQAIGRRMDAGHHAARARTHRTMGGDEGLRFGVGP